MTDSNGKRKSASEAERDVEAARANLVQSIDDLVARLSPNALVDQGVAYFKGDGRRHVDTLADRAQANPMSLLLIGIGFAWLALGPKRAPGSEPIGHHVPRGRPVDLDRGAAGGAPDPYATPSAAGLAPHGSAASSPADRLGTEGLSRDAGGTGSNAPVDGTRQSRVATGVHSTDTNDTPPTGDVLRVPTSELASTEKDGVSDGRDASSILEPGAVAGDRKRDGGTI